MLSVSSDSTVKRRRRVAIVLPYMNTYRVPFLIRLRDLLDKEGIELLVATGRPTGVDRSRGDSTIEFESVMLRQFEIPIVKFRVRLIPRSVVKSDLVVVEHAVSNVDSHVLLSWRGKKRPTALWGHGYTITKPQPAAIRFIQKLMIARSSWYFAYTKGSALRAIELGMDHDRCTVLNNTVEPPKSVGFSARATRNVDRETWTALFIGGLDGSKRLPFLLEAAEYVHRQDSRFRLLIVGDGSDRPLVERAASLDYVEYLGRRSLSDLGQRLDDLRVIAMPGRVGLVAIDSFAIGAPVVTTNWQFHAPEFEYLTEANSVVTDDDVSSYAAGILGLMQGAEKLSRLSDGARQTLREYTVDEMAERFARGVVEALRGVTA